MFSRRPGEYLLRTRRSIVSTDSPSMILSISDSLQVITPARPYLHDSDDKSSESLSRNFRRETHRSCGETGPEMNRSRRETHRSRHDETHRSQQMTSWSSSEWSRTNRYLQEPLLLRTRRTLAETETMDFLFTRRSRKGPRSWIFSEDEVEKFVLSHSHAITWR